MKNKKILEYLINKNKELENELIKIYNSKTWKLLYIYKKNIYLLKNIFKIKNFLDKKFPSKIFNIYKGYFEKNKVIGITHTYWTGVFNATINQCNYVIGLNKKIEKKEEILEIIKTIKKLKINKIAINGVLDGIEILLESLFKIKKLDIYLIWHGSFTQQTIEDHIERFNRIKKYINKFKKIGFLKNEMNEIFKILNYNSEFIPNTFNKNIIIENKKNNKNNLNIGIFGWWSWHKNNLNQIIAASIIKNVKIHTLYYPNNIFYLNKIVKNKIIKYYYLSHDKVLNLISKMDIILNVSLTECYPNIILESFYFSKPILLGKFADNIIKNNYLKKVLIVENPENINEIKNKILFIINNYEDVVKKINNYYKKLIEENNKQIISFFNN